MDTSPYLYPPSCVANGVGSYGVRDDWLIEGCVAGLMASQDGRKDSTAETS